MEERIQAELPRFLIAAEKSGQGKTMLTCALLSLLKDRGMEVQAFKCGPDYIDPMFHRQVLGVPSRNLDSFFSTENQLCGIMGRCGTAGQHESMGCCGITRCQDERMADGGAPEQAGSPERHGGKIAVVEGVMGYYDGLGGTSDAASTYEAARLTKTPVILIADASGRSLSVLAAIKGFLSYRPDSQIRGILFNRLSPMLYPALKETAERELNIPVVGYVPVLSDFTLESRHLGLIMPREIPEFRKKVQTLAGKIRPGIDLDAILSIADAAPPLSWTPEPIPAVKTKRGDAPVIAVAMDEAFCFYYQENFDVLAAMGGRLTFFSPLHDTAVPSEADALYLGGGYPELFGRELSENRSMRESIKRAVENHMPCIAECGGFLYLKERLEDGAGTSWPMCGVLPGGSRNAGRLTRFGYGTMTAETDGVLGPAGCRFPAHEFHHWDGEENGDAFLFQKPVGRRTWSCGYTTKTLYAGFPHLYFYGHYPVDFLERAAGFREEREETDESCCQKND